MHLPASEVSDRGAAPRRSRSPWRPAQMTYRSRVGGGGLNSRGGAAPPAPPLPRPAADTRPLAHAK